MAIHSRVLFLLAFLVGWANISSAQIPATRSEVVLSIDGRNFFIHTAQEGQSVGDIAALYSLDEGEVSVYYMTALSDVEQPLFSLEGGESIEGERRGYLTNGEDPQVVIEAGEGGARGCKINIEIVH